MQAGLLFTPVLALLLLRSFVTFLAAELCITGYVTMAAVECLFPVGGCVSMQTRGAPPRTRISSMKLLIVGAAKVR